MSSSLSTHASLSGRPPLTPRHRPLLALAAIVGTQMMLLLDATVVNVALPDLGVGTILVTVFGTASRGSGAGGGGAHAFVDGAAAAFGGAAVFTALALGLVLAVRVAAPSTDG